MYFSFQAKASTREASAALRAWSRAPFISACTPCSSPNCAATASAKAITGQLGAEQGAHLLTKGALAEALKVAEASRVEGLDWKKKSEGESC